MHPWIAQRTRLVDSSGIRKVFDLAAKLNNPINLSIGQPDFPVPDSIKQSAIRAIESDRNGYSPTQGIPALHDRLQADIDAHWNHPDRKLLVTSGTSGALVLAMLAMVDPGDEVICFDPYFVMYQPLIGLVGGKCVPLDTYPEFRIDLAKVEAAITDKTKLILLNSPGNPTGVVASEAEAKGLAEIASRHNIALLSDEIYSRFCYDAPLVSPAQWNDQTLVVDGFSKTYGVTGWRIGYIHGPSEVIDKMTALQQYTFVCAPQPLQWSMLEALDYDMSPQVDLYRQRRDLMVSGLRDAGYEVADTAGAFYVFPKAPWGTSSEFTAKAIEHELLMIPGKIFSTHDTHFRISYAATMETLERALEVLRAIRSK